ncbi:MAG: hypothetical protein EOP42_01160 [Sphingobacteriaceae bacterium]|nr:MAG: hypothetical protein EOP42_01160 [Sphingobacteriaceae bacterium]
MTMYSHHYFTLLKECVLAKAGIKQLIPSECQKLSTLIFTSTKKTVSETTLKRIYGFAVSKFKPSPFTLQALAEYCGYDGWEAFCLQEEVTENLFAEKNTWQNMYKRANRTTQFTLQSLKKRSGIPYNLTIKRKFMEEHFNAFLQTEKTATLFTAQAGYGKTIGLCHLVEDLISENTESINNQNVILYFSTHTINSIAADNLNLGDWFLSFLGFPSIKSLIDLFEENEPVKTNFYLIIDGFDEFRFKPDQYLIFFNQLIDIISYYSKYPWFKIVLTMRSSTWLNYKYLVEEQPELYEKWFTGFMLDENHTNNFLPFDTDEILTLTHKINPQSKSNLLPAVELIQKLSYPLFFQLFYQDNPDNFTIAETDYLNFYQVICSFAYHKVYQGKNSMEKVLLLKTLLDQMDHKNNSFSVPKILFREHIRQYSATYKDLIANDIIKEENFSKLLVYQEQISFANDTVFEYCLAKKFYHWNNSKLDESLIHDLENLVGKSAVKVPVIKWLTFFIINYNDYEQFNYLKEFTLEPSEKLEVIIFTCKLLQKKLSETTNHEKLKLYFTQIEQSEIFSFFLSLQYSTPDYEKALHTLLSFNLNNKNKILIYTTLALMSILNLNAPKADKYLHEVHQFPEQDLEGFIINPYLCLDTIYTYFKFGIVKKEVLQKITHLYYNDYQLRKLHGWNYHYNEIILKLALITLRLNDNPFKELRFIKIVSKNFESAHIKENSTLSRFFSGSEASAYLRTGNIKQALKKQNQFLKIQDSDYNFYTPFMKVFFSMLSARTSIQNQAYKVALLQAKTLIAYSSKNGYLLAGVYTAINYLTSSNIENIDHADLVEIYNYILKTIRSSGFRLESFIAPGTQHKIESLLGKNSKVA